MMQLPKRSNLRPSWHRTGCSYFIGQQKLVQWLIT